MSPAFNRWLKKVDTFQKRRAAGQSPDPDRELDEIASTVDSLVVDGLDYVLAARSLVELERAALLNERRDFAGALKLAESSTVAPGVAGAVAELITVNRELLIGSIYLVQGGDAKNALPFFDRAIEASSRQTSLACGNAAINKGICHHLLNDKENALRSYELAARNYEIADRPDKIAVALHSIGNVYRTKGETRRAIAFFHGAIEQLDDQHDSHMLWYTYDDLSRAYLTLAQEQPAEREKWLALAVQTSDIATAASSEVWNGNISHPERLLDLSDQIANHIVTRCDIADGQESAFGILGTLAQMKGRLRLANSPIPADLLSRQSEIVQEGIRAGYPLSHIFVVADSMKAIAAESNMALLDQFALRGDELVMGYMISASGQCVFGGNHDKLPGASQYDGASDLRGRLRGLEIINMCNRLLEKISRHRHRCAMVLPEDLSQISDSIRQHLRDWSGQLEPELRELGTLFFPPAVLKEFRARKVEHVVLCIDPLFGRLPYSALLTESGAILDEPWTLSLVSASTELIRILDRRNRLIPSTRNCCWFGPDANVNQNLGGDDELTSISALMTCTELRETRATLSQLVQLLSNGHWCHFRGHGRWTGLVETSGIVLANDEVLCSNRYPVNVDNPGFLFTAACYTGFGEAVGVELLGSLVDYDRAGLLGAVLTNWPIHGEAATITTGFFYEKLASSMNVAIALKTASQRTRDFLPHPYFWAPFSLLGEWKLDGMFQPIGKQEGSATNSA